MKIERNEPCPCWSGKKYKKCCYLTGDDPFEKFKRTKSKWSLDERNNLLYNGVWDIFKFSKGRTWEEFRKNLSDGEVREFYKFYSWLYPVTTDVIALLPEPKDTILRGLYIGENSVKKIANNVLRYSLYTDEILVVNPFPHPDSFIEEYNPIYNPQLYKQDLLEQVFLMARLEPWIKSGIVKLIPNVIDFDPRLRKEIYSSAKERFGNMQEEYDKYFQSNKSNIDKEGKEMLMNMLVRLPRSAQISQIKKVFPDMSADKIESQLQYINELRKNNPLLLDQELPEGGELRIKRMGANLELGMFVAQLTGSYLYTNNSFQWTEILSATAEKDHSDSPWSPLTQAFQKLDFNFLENVDAKFAYQIKEEGRLSNLRNYLRNVWASIQSDTIKDNKILEFKDELTGEYQKTREEWSDIDRALRNWTFSKGGLVAGITGLASIITGGINPLIPALGFVLPAVGKLLEANSGRRKFKSTVPLSVFLDLEKKDEILK